MKVYRSNRVERLLDALGSVLVEPSGADPLASECIIVQSRAMGVWLSMRLSERFGVWAGAAFPFPRRFVDQAFEAVLGQDASGAEAYHRDRLVWSVLAQLPGRLDDDAFAELRRYLDDDPRGLRRFQLASRIADRFDQYAVFRPDVVLGWERGRGEDWQAQLWRAIASHDEGAHPAALAERFFDRLGGDGCDLHMLPPRVCAFGLSTLPPFYVEVLAGLSKHIDVHLFVVSPSREYWGDTRSRRQPDPDVPPLLASLGGVGRDFQAVLENTGNYEEPGEDLYHDPGDATVLAALQSDILNLRRSERGTPSDDDDSIAVMACHSPMREVEVLHDHILDLLARDPSLEPRDIVVMMSDVETYAPIVEAVFERDADDPVAIPYCIADRSVRSASPATEAVHRVLALVGGRVAISEVLDLLMLDAVQARFGIDPDDIDVITEWATEAGIRWGVDAKHRRHHGQPAFDGNTWRFGLDRLMLGYALPGRGRETFAGVLPYDEIEGTNAELLGRFAEFSDRLFDLLARLAAPRPVRAWQAILGETMESLLTGGAGAAWDLSQLRAVLEQMAVDAEAAGMSEPIELETIKQLLEQRTEDNQPARGFLAAGVTFCAMLPMRSVPFRVVCMVGLSDTMFPRSGRLVGFDIMAGTPRPGDRSRRADDRYLFLEALLAARERFVATYVGQSIQDNSDIPPSVVLADLLDACDGKESLVVRHPMQPFSPRYFDGKDPELFSYGTQYLPGARAIAVGPGDTAGAALLREALPPLEADDGALPLPLSRLVRFFRQPAAELLKRRLGIYLDEYSRDRSDREPMELPPLEEWRVGHDLLEHQLEGVPAERSLELLRAGGGLPLGTPGECRYEAISAIVDPIAAAARDQYQGEPLAPLPIDLALGRSRIIGTLGARWRTGLVTHQYARLSAKHLLAAWIRHLALCVTAPKDQEKTTTLISRDDKGRSARICSFRPVEEAAKILSRLTELYWLGLSEPLMLFPRSSLALCRAALEKGGNAQTSVAAARAEWSDRWHGERDDPHLRRLFGHGDPLSPGFTLFDRPMAGGDFLELSVEVFGPLLTHLEEI